jgi:hypothetical protein
VQAQRFQHNVPVLFSHQITVSLTTHVFFRIRNINIALHNQLFNEIKLDSEQPFMQHYFGRQNKLFLTPS